MYRSMQPQMILDVSGVKSYPAALVIPVKNHLKNYLYMTTKEEYNNDPVFILADRAKAELPNLEQINNKVWIEGDDKLA